MFVFGGKKKDNNMQMESKEPDKKKKKKKGKEDDTPVYENPAFEIFDPGSSFNAQSGFISQQQQTTTAATEPAPQPLPDQPPYDPNQQPQPVVVSPEVPPAQPVEQLQYQPDPAAQPIAYDPNVQVVAYDPAAQPVAVDPAQAVAYDPSAQGFVDPVAQQQALEQEALAQQQAYQAVDPTQAAQQGGIEMLEPAAPVDYNNVLPAEAQQQEAAPLSADAAAANGVSSTEKVARPEKRFRYTIINGIGKKENGTFDAESEDDVRNFLLSQDYQVLEVKERSASDIDIGGNGKMGANDLSFSLTQLSTYLRAGIPLSDSVRILAKQSKKPNIKKSFNQLVYQLLKGESLSDAMIMQDKVYPKLLINMVKTAEMTGDLPSILDDMSEYYTSMDQTKKQMKSAMTYPAVVLTIATGVLVFMMTYLVPQFTSMFEEQGAELPFLTKMIVAVSTFMINKWYVPLAIIAGIGIAFYLCYTKIQKFRLVVQIILMHMPVVGNIIVYNEIANFSKTFASLLNHSVFITDSMEILSKITSNEVYKGIINKTLENLAKGDSISSAFRGEWAIPVVAYEMIVTGESTGQLGAMMEKVAAHFQMLHKNVIDQMKSLVEPVMIVFLAGIVGVILVSIIQPMFSIYSQIK